MTPTHLSKDQISQLGRQALEQASAAAFGAHVNHMGEQARLAAIEAAINAAVAAKAAPPAKPAFGVPSPDNGV